MELEDLYSFKIIDDPQISNDGKFIAYTQTVASKQYNNYRSKIVIYEMNAIESLQIDDYEDLYLVNNIMRNMYKNKKPQINSSFRFSFPDLFPVLYENNFVVRHAMTTQYGIIRLYLRETHKLHH